MKDLNEYPTPATDAVTSNYYPMRAVSLSLERRLAACREALEAVCNTAVTIQNLDYGPDGDCGASRIADRIESLCSETLAATAKP